MVAGEGFEPSKAEPGDLQSPASAIGLSGLWRIEERIGFNRSLNLSKSKFDFNFRVISQSFYE